MCVCVYYNYIYIWNRDKTGTWIQNNAAKSSKVKVVKHQLKHNSIGQEHTNSNSNIDTFRLDAKNIIENNKQTKKKKEKNNQSHYTNTIYTYIKTKGIQYTVGLFENYKNILWNSELNIMY